MADRDAEIVKLLKSIDSNTASPDRRRIQMFFAVVIFLGLLAGAAAVNTEIWYWDSTGLSQSHA